MISSRFNCESLTKKNVMHYYGRADPKKVHITFYYGHTYGTVWYAFHYI